MRRRGAIKTGSLADPGLNHLLAATASKNDSQPPPSFEDQSRLMFQMKYRNLKNSYAFVIRYADKSRTIFFAKDEADRLAADIGIDIDRDKTSHMWFLQQALLSALPYGWRREQDFDGRTIYHNDFTNEACDSHPNVYRFRSAFNAVLQAEATKRRLLAEGSRSISGRERASLQVQLSSLTASEKIALVRRLRAGLNREEAATVGDLTRQIIKWLRDRNNRFGIKENLNIVYDGKSAFRFREILSQVEKRMKPAEVLALSEDTAALRLAEDEAARWYNERLPENVCECPREVQTTAEYQHADIDSMLASAAELDIDPVKEPYLLWIPRMQVAMGLPQFWRRKILDGNVVYYSLQHDVVCRTHPGKQFWDRFVDRIRELAATVDRRSLVAPYAPFHDALMREYDETGSTSKRGVRNQDCTPRYSSAAERFVTPKDEKALSRHDVASGKAVGEITDMEILEIARCCGVNVRTESHLLGSIEEILRQLKLQLPEAWEFRISEKGQPYWTSNKTHACTQRHPLMQKIQEELEDSRNSIRKLTESDAYRLTARIPVSLSGYMSATKGVYERVKTEANGFMNAIIVQKLAETTGKLETRKAYNLRSLAELIGKTLSKQEALDVLFACPFELPKLKLRVGPRAQQKPETAISGEEASEQENDSDNETEEEGEVHHQPIEAIENVPDLNPGTEITMKKLPGLATEDRLDSRIKQRVSRFAEQFGHIPSMKPAEQRKEEDTKMAFSIKEGGEATEKKYDIDAKEVETKLRRMKLVDNIQRREMEKVVRRRSSQNVLAPEEQKTEPLIPVRRNSDIAVLIEEMRRGQEALQLPEAAVPRRKSTQALITLDPVPVPRRKKAGHGHGSGRGNAEQELEPVEESPVASLSPESPSVRVVPGEGEDERKNEGPEPKDNCDADAPSEDEKEEEEAKGEGIMITAVADLSDRKLKSNAKTTPAKADATIPPPVKHNPQQKRNPSPIAAKLPEPLGSTPQNKNPTANKPVQTEKRPLLPASKGKSVGRKLPVIVTSKPEARQDRPRIIVQSSPSKETSKVAAPHPGSRTEEKSHDGCVKEESSPAPKPTESTTAAPSPDPVLIQPDRLISKATHLPEVSHVAAVEASEPKNRSSSTERKGSVPVRVLSRSAMARRASRLRERLEKRKQQQEVGERGKRTDKNVETSHVVEDFEAKMKSILVRSEGEPLVDFSFSELKCEDEKEERPHWCMDAESGWDPTMKRRIRDLLQHSDERSQSELRVRGYHVKQYNQTDKKLYTSTERVAEASPEIRLIPAPDESEQPLPESESTSAPPPLVAAAASADNSPKEIRPPRVVLVFKRNARTGAKTRPASPTDLRSPSEPSATKPVDPFGSMSPFRKLLALRSISIRRADASSRIVKLRPRIKVLLSSAPRLRASWAGLRRNPASQNEEDEHFVKKLGTGTDPVPELRDSQDFRFFEYYVRKLGNPRTCEPLLHVSSPVPGLRPTHVLAMAMRLGAPEIDPNIIKAAYCQLAVPVPPESEHRETDEWCASGLGRHPGDAYFAYATQKAKVRAAPGTGEGVVFPFCEEDGTGVYYFDFASMQRTGETHLPAAENGERRRGEVPLQESTLSEDYVQALSVLQQFKVHTHISQRC